MIWPTVFEAPAPSLDITPIKPIWHCRAGAAQTFEARPEAQCLAAKDQTSALNTSNMTDGIS